MNMDKLAALSGVSLGTVSKAFSGSEEISKETRDKIFDIAKQNNCFEKYVKKRIDKKIIAVICPEIASAFYTSIVSYLEEEIEKRNGVMILSLSNFDAKKEAELVSYHKTLKNADGIIVIEAYSKVKYDKDIPIVVMNAAHETKDIDSVNTDFLSPICDAVKLLASNGHTKIGFIGENLTGDKQSFFSSAMQKNNLLVNPDYIFVSGNRFETAGYEGMEKLYSQKDMPTAIFAAYDYIALGAIQNIKAHGQNVPDDFSIIGVDDISFASHYNISLTTIRSNTNDICDIILDLLFKKLENKYYRLRQNITVRGELVVRNSVKNITK